jgi:seryl-tRNA(Sec) selenium transferase
MRMVGESIRRGSIVLAGTCLALDLTGFSATAVVGRNSAATPAAANRLAESSEHVRKCPNGLVSDSDSNTCDPEERSND